MGPYKTNLTNSKNIASCIVSSQTFLTVLVPQYVVVAHNKWAFNFDVFGFPLNVLTSSDQNQIFFLLYVLLFKQVSMYIFWQQAAGQSILIFCSHTSFFMGRLQCPCSIKSKMLFGLDYRQTKVTDSTKHPCYSEEQKDSS